MATVELNNIYKAFERDVYIIKDLDLKIQDGEFLVLVGPSGCGKSTLLRMVAGLETPTSGEIKIDGIVVNDFSPKDRDIAMVFQNYALYPHMNVFGNLAFSLKLRKVGKSEIMEMVQKAAKMLEIENLLQRKPKELSGGQRQRVALGRAIVRNPKVFLFDEPLSNLDAKLRVQMRAEIKKFHKQISATMIYVTHDQVEAMTMGDRIVILKDGIIQQIGTPNHIYSDPSNAFVAGFIGSPAMNLIPGKISGSKFYAGDDTIDISGLTFPGKLDGNTVILGIRPENILLNDRGNEFPINVVEPLGNETLLHVLIGGKTYVVKVLGDKFMSFGEFIKIKLDVSKIFLFEKATGKRLA